MADSNEAQLLNQLLRDIAQEDARLESPHLEARVVDALASSRLQQPRLGPARAVRWAIAAAVAAAVLVPAVSWRSAEAPGPAAVLSSAGIPDATVDSIEAAPPPESARSARAAARDAAPRSVQKAGPAPDAFDRASRRDGPADEAFALAARSLVEPSTTQISQSRDEFIPLMPMTEQELAGSFQLVRVQMPRASLGALRSPLEHPSELVEADVLLGQDGMARAIRVSTSGFAYPWRSR